MIYTQEVLQVVSYPNLHAMYQYIVVLYRNVVQIMHLVRNVNTTHCNLQNYYAAVGACVSLYPVTIKIHTLAGSRNPVVLPHWLIQAAVKYDCTEQTP
jgi:hypothetical protein